MRSFSFFVTTQVQRTLAKYDPNFVRAKVRRCLNCL